MYRIPDLQGDAESIAIDPEGNWRSSSRFAALTDL